MGAHAAVAVQTVEGLFSKVLPAAWVEAIARGVEAAPLGHSRGPNLVTNKLASPEKAPAIAVVGDAGHATTPRMGYGLQCAIETSIALVAALQGASGVNAALRDFNASRQPDMTALSSLDRLVRFCLVFFLTLALLCRPCLPACMVLNLAPMHRGMRGSAIILFPAAVAQPICDSLVDTEQA